jgi:hypothetical protein
MVYLDACKKLPSMEQIADISFFEKVTFKLMVEPQFFLFFFGRKRGGWWGWLSLGLSLKGGAVLPLIQV